MTDVKEKGEELIKKFMPHSSGDSNNNEAKQCALICVEEIIKCLPSYADQVERNEQSSYFWNQVKAELEKR